MESFLKSEGFEPENLELVETDKINSLKQLCDKYDTEFIQSSEEVATVGAHIGVLTKEEENGFFYGFGLLVNNSDTGKKELWLGHSAILGSTFRRVTNLDEKQQDSLNGFFPKEEVS